MKLQEEYPSEAGGPDRASAACDGVRSPGGRGASRLKAGMAWRISRLGLAGPTGRARLRQGLPDRSTPPGPLRRAWDEFAGLARQNLPMARRLLPTSHMPNGELIQ